MAIFCILVLVYKKFIKKCSSKRRSSQIFKKVPPLSGVCQLKKKTKYSGTSGKTLAKNMRQLEFKGSSWHIIPAL